MIGLVSAEGQIGIRLTPTWRCSYARPVVSLAVEKNRCSYSMPLNNLQSSLPSDSSAVIEFRKVNKWFGSLHVLKDIDLSIDAGRVFVVCGPSGSGKSTLIRCINRLETFQSGSLTVDGLSLADTQLDPVRLRANVGMVFQSFNLYPHMTVLRNITLAPIKA